MLNTVIIATAYKIHQMNQEPNNPNYINMKGISIGDGMMDPCKSSIKHKLFHQEPPQ